MATIDDMTEEEWAQFSDDRYAEVTIPYLRIQFFFNDAFTTKESAYVSAELMNRFPSGHIVNIDNTLTFMFDITYGDEEAEDLIDGFFLKKMPICIASLINRIQIEGPDGSLKVVLKPSFAMVEESKNHCRKDILTMLLFSDNPCIASLYCYTKKVLYGAIRAIASLFLFQPIVVDKSCKKESIEEWNASKTKYVVDCCTNKMVEDIDSELAYGEANYGNECYRCIVKEFNSDESYVLHIRCCYFNEALYSSMFSTMPSKVFAYITPN